MSQFTYTSSCQVKNITTGTTTDVLVGQGRLVSITVNTTAAGTIAIQDYNASTTVTIGTLKASVVEGTYWYNCVMARGIRIITGAASDITVTYIADNK